MFIYIFRFILWCIVYNLFLLFLFTVLYCFHLSVTGLQFIFSFSIGLDVEKSNSGWQTFSQ